jgi:hypothetical protein
LPTLLGGDKKGPVKVLLGLNLTIIVLTLQDRKKNLLASIGALGPQLLLAEGQRVKNWPAC